MNSIYFNTTNLGTRRNLIFQSISVLFISFSVLILSGCQQKKVLDECSTYERRVPDDVKIDTSVTALTANVQNYIKSDTFATAFFANVQIINPYKHYPYFHKGQVHCHSNRGREDGAGDVKQLLEQYRSFGYNFVCVTEHDRRKKGGIGGIFGQTESTPCKLLFEDPGVPGILYIPGEEGGKENRTHFIGIGLTRENPCRPSGGFDLLTRIYWVENQGGIAVAPHMTLEGHAWNDEELFHYRWLRGIELRKNTNDVAVWDRLLKADRTRWGFCVDDAHNAGSADVYGCIVVNSNQSQPNKADIINNIREGNFYAVLYDPDRRPDHQKPNPHLRIISTGSTGDFAHIAVSFNGGHTIRFIGRDGILKEESGYDENKPYLSFYKCNGTEGYVRIELLNSEGTISYSQPLFVYGNSNEACVPINYEKAEVISQTTYWVIYDGKLVAVFDDEQRARKALAIIKNYKVDRQCFIGSPRPSMKYFTVNGQAPSGAYPGEESVAFDPNNLQVKFVTFPRPPIRSWRIIEGDNIWSLPSLDFKDSEIQARRGLEIIKRYGFTHLCSVGGTNEMRYFRR